MEAITVNVSPIFISTGALDKKKKKKEAMQLLKLYGVIMGHVKQAFGFTVSLTNHLA